MNKIHLIGDIGDKFGHEWNANVSSYGEIMRLIDANREGFQQYLLEAEENDIAFTIQRAGEFIEDGPELLLNLNNEDIIITAVPIGAKGGFMGSGFGKLVMGAVLFVLGWYAPQLATTMTGTSTTTVTVAKWGQVLNAALQTIGVSLMTQGATEMLMSDPTKGNAESGYLFRGGTNTIIQGQPVPLLYGELLIPGQPISATMSTRRPNVGWFQYYNPTISSTSATYSSYNTGNTGGALRSVGGTVTSDDGTEDDFEER